MAAHAAQAADRDSADPAAGPAGPLAPRPDTSPAQPRTSSESLPVKLLHDRVLVSLETAEGERTSTGGILIPATAAVGKRLVWAKAVGVGPNVRSIEAGDRVLFEPEDRSEVELHGTTYVLLRERDVHAVASTRVQPESTGLYL